MSSTGTELTRTTVGSVTNQYKWTYSFWVKRTDLGTGATNSFVFDWYQSGSNRGGILFENDNTLKIYDRVSNANALDKRTNRVFRDINAWYHIVIAHDRSISSPVTKIYVNGVEETSLMSSTDPSQNGTSYFNTTSQTERIGNYGNGSEYSQMIMSHVHFCDGYYYQASDFGETDSTTGEWKIKTSPSVSYGTNGFFILKDGNSVTDQSGNGNNFTVAGGTLTKTEDCPSNVFATLNPLIPMRGTPTYQSGNTYFRSDYTNWDSALSTIGATSGKWYFEAKWGGQDNLMIGCVDVDKDPEFLSAQGTYGYLGHKGISYFGQSSNAKVIGNGNQDLYTGLTSFAQNDIIGCAIDLDNREMFVHKNGTYTNSGNPATRANPYDMSTSINQGGHVLMGVASRSGYGVEVNFGNGYFSSTAVSSAGTNASGIGIFEYDVPTGYTALSTKGLNL